MSPKTLLIATTVLSALALGFSVLPALRAADAPAAKAEERVFEQRTYHCSPGKLPDLQKRFREHTVKLFEKHGMTNIGYWTPAEGQTGAGETLIYVLAYPSMEAAKKSWADFRADPEWVKVKADSEADGIPLAAKVDSVLMNPTDFSLIK